MMKSRLLFFVSAALLFLMTCKHEPVLLPEKSDIEANGNCHPDTVYFQNEILPMMVSRCGIIGCHGAPSTNPQKGLSLTSYNGVMNEITPGDPDDSDIYERITHSDQSKRMPPSGNTELTGQEIWKIRQWILQGARNNSCTPTLCDTSQVTFSGSVLPIINAKCRGCHSGGNNNYVLVTHFGFRTAAIDDGKVIPAIEHATGFPNTYMPPFGAPKLSQCEINTIKIWIGQGGPDN